MIECGGKETVGTQNRHVVRRKCVWNIIVSGYIHNLSMRLIELMIITFRKVKSYSFHLLTASHRMRVLSMGDSFLTVQCFQHGWVLLASLGGDSGRTQPSHSLRPTKSVNLLLPGQSGYIKYLPTFHR